MERVSGGFLFFSVSLVSARRHVDEAVGASLREAKQEFRFQPRDLVHSCSGDPKLLLPWVLSQWDAANPNSNESSIGFERGVPFVVSFVVFLWHKIHCGRLQGACTSEGALCTFLRAHACVASTQQCTWATAFLFDLFQDIWLRVPMIITIELPSRI